MSKKTKKTAEVKEEVKTRKCSKCGTENPLSQIVCPNCGERLDKKADKLAELKTQKAAVQKTVKEKKVAEKKYSRMDAIASSILTLRTFTRDELVNKADALMEQNGGKANKALTLSWLGGFLPMLTRLGVLTNGEGKEYHFVKPEEVKAE